uniref:Uncharacterized protein n=1 Tax=Anopheles darlingi TaxID=43151 RepID=A0A2M4D501_ANODA
MVLGVLTVLFESLGMGVLISLVSACFLAPCIGLFRLGALLLQLVIRHHLYHLHGVRSRDSAATFENHFQLRLRNVGEV